MNFLYYGKFINKDQKLKKVPIPFKEIILECLICVLYAEIKTFYLFYQRHKNHEFNKHVKTLHLYAKFYH